MDVAPLPPVGIGMVLGLLEMLEDAKGREDIFRLARSLSLELDDIGPVIEAATLLGFIETSNGDISLTELGKSLLAADINGRKAILARQLKTLNVFQKVLQLLNSTRKRSVRREKVVDLFEQSMSDEDAEQLFQTIVDWGRFAEVIAYDTQGERLYLE
ncbi:AAA-associated domain-containing protein [Moorellaceae bacterium AZ2]